MILACAVLIQLQSVTNGQTDDWTMAKTREPLHAVERKKISGTTYTNYTVSDILANLLHALIVTH